MSRLGERIGAFVDLGKYLEQPGPALLRAVEEAGWHNPWFTEENVFHALHGIRTRFLDRAALVRWTETCRVPDRPRDPKTIGMVLAGNIPLVGFHDLLCVLISGHRLQVKPSEKDKILTVHILDWLKARYEGFEKAIDITGRLSGFDAVVATGSNNAARYFDYYFGRYPGIIRRNRNGVAVLWGDESPEDLGGICEDIFRYFGMGCRNVSAILLPREADPGPLLEASNAFTGLLDHGPWRNNYDYQLAVMLLSREPFFQGASILLREDPRLVSPLSVVHLIRYDDPDDLRRLLEVRRTEIQCVVSTRPVPGWEVVAPGQTQVPGLTDYADGVDTMAFLQSLSV